MSIDRWTDSCRLEQWVGVVRVNLIRAVALLVFYGRHLIDVCAIGDDMSGAKR